MRRKYTKKQVLSTAIEVVYKQVGRWHWRKLLITWPDNSALFRAEAEVISADAYIPGLLLLVTPGEVVELPMPLISTREIMADGSLFALEPLYIPLIDMDKYVIDR